jgi:hypothetical protein
MGKFILTGTNKLNAELYVYKPSGASFRVGQSAPGIIDFNFSDTEPGDVFTIDWEPEFNGFQTALFAIPEDEPENQFTRAFHASTWRNDINEVRVSENGGFTVESGDGDDDDKQDGFFDGWRPGKSFFGFGIGNPFSFSVLAASVATATGIELTKKRKR